jgi:RecB family endonuclease NucS
MIRNHYVVSKKANGDIDLHPMKAWLRANPSYLPAGLHPDTSTSHQLRRALRDNGWRQEDQPDRVLLIRPEDKGADALVEALNAETEDDEQLIEAGEITFGLERDLQAALRANIGQLEAGLKIIDGGKENANEAGRIDITAEDASGHVVVIELKAGMAAPEAVTQILAYMGTVAAQEGKPVRGILVAGDFHKKVLLASRAVSNLDLKKYSFQFKFSASA